MIFMEKIALIFIALASLGFVWIICSMIVHVISDRID
jgi:hypothetical protein